MLLRPYQRQAIDAAYAFLAKGPGNPLIVLPTGAGKSPVLTTMCKEAVEQWGGRVLVLTHVKELINQLYETINRVWASPLGKAPVGVYSAGLGMRQTNEPVTIGGIQSVYKRGTEIGRVDIILVDEAHLIPTDGDGMYQTLITTMRVINPAVRIIGLTATPYRLDSGWLAGPGRIFSEICYEASVRTLIDEQWLSMVRGKDGGAPDLSEVHKRGGEYIPEELEAAMTDDALVKHAVEEINKYGKDRKAWLIFCCGVSHAHMVAKALRESGEESCAVITGETPTIDRDEWITAYKEKRLKCLVNVNVLTTGFDAPHVDLIIMLRPTLSPGLYSQMAGRGLRKADGKSNCICEGELILTNTGLVPIEKVSTDMLVWDGREFVSHDGPIYKGYSDVITYAGITATPDHMFWTKEGWKTLGECSFKQIAISVTGNGRKTIREADGCFTRSIQEAESTLDDGAVHVVPSGINKRIQLFSSRISRMQKMRKTTTRTNMAGTAMRECKKQVHKYKGSSIRGLWWSGDKVSISFRHRHGCLPYAIRANETRKKHADRSNRQQRPLSNREYKNIDTITKSVSHKKKNDKRQASFIQKRSSGNKICRFNFVHDVQRGNDCGRNNRAMVPTVLQTKRKVWDILNCGPLHRFTVNGLLAHNCMILDLAGNISRHGPIDNVRVKTKRPSDGDTDGEAPTKTCPKCAEILPLSALVCHACGFEFPKAIAKHEAKASDAQPLTVYKEEWYDVKEVIWNVHNKKGADASTPKTLRVSYSYGWRQLVSEFICVEHQGYARNKAVDWCRDHLPSDITIPMIAADLMDLIDRIDKEGKFKKPSRIKIREGGQWPEMIDKEYEDLEQQVDKDEPFPASTPSYEPDETTPF